LKIKVLITGKLNTYVFYN